MRKPSSVRSSQTPLEESSKHLDRFGALLTLSILAVIVLSLVDLSDPTRDVAAEVGATAVTALLGMTLLLALRASGVARRWRRPAEVLVVAGLAITVLLLVIDLTTDADVSSIDNGGPSVLWIALSALTVVAVARRLLRHERVSRGTLLGAIAAYLLIAILFDLVFLYVDAAQATPFFGSPEPTTNFMYFSLITVTTVGYGDLVPATPLAKLVAGADALIGQVFLVTFVAMLVSLFVQSRRGKPRPQSGDVVGSQADTTPRGR